MSSAGWATSTARLFAWRANPAKPDTPLAGPDPDAYLNDALTGGRLAHQAQNFSSETVRRRIATLRPLADFVGSYPTRPDKR